MVSELMHWSFIVSAHGGSTKKAATQWRKADQGLMERRSGELLRDWQLPNPFARSRKNRVANGGRNRRDTWLSDAGRRSITIHDVNVSLKGRFIDARHPVPVEIGLLDLSARDRSEEHTSELQSHSFISYAVFC